MKSFLRICAFSACVLFALLTLSCPGGGTPAPLGPQGIQGPIKFNLTGAKAVGAADIAATRAIKGLEGFPSVKSALSRAATDEYGLVKVLEDGTVQMAVEFPEGIWMPRVLFIAKSPVAGSKDLYVALESNITYWDAAANEQVSLGSFLHILEDGSYYSVIDMENGRVKNYSWYGNDNYKPVSFDSSGRLYFVFENYGVTSSSNQLFRYDPATHVSTPLTAPLSGTQYNNFEVSPDGQRLFVQGERYSAGNRSSFFRMYPVSGIENPVSVYYSSSSNIWIRGYKVSPAGVVPQSVILNGSGIRGTNGLLKANVLSDTSISYEPLFDSSTSWFNPTYSEWYSEWESKTYYDGYFDRYSTYDLYVAMTDGTDVFYLPVSSLKDSYPRYSTALQSLTVYEKPEASDWLARGQIDKSLDPRPVTGSFGFAMDNGLGGLSIIRDTVVADPANPAYTVRSYFDNISPADKAKMIVVNIQNRCTDGVNALEKIGADPGVIEPLLAPGASTVYKWNAHWLNGDQSLKKAEVMAYAAKYFIDTPLFKHGASVAGDASFDSFYNPAKRIYSQAEIGDGPYFLNTYFVKADGATPAKTFKKFKDDNNLPWLNFQNVSSLYYDGTGACWAAIGGGAWGGGSTMRPVKILDAAGRKTLECIPAFNGNAFNPVSILVAGNELFFRDGLLDADGFETGYHKLYAVDLTALGAAPVDVLGQVPGNGRIEIVSFSVNGAVLYFTGVQGTGVVGGKIDLETLAYTPMSQEYMLRDIQIY